MKLYPILLFGFLFVLTGCKQQSYDDWESLDRFTHTYNTTTLDGITRFLFIPLSGCDDYIDPLLGHIKSYWQCTEVNESSYLVLSADWPSN